MQLWGYYMPSQTLTLFLASQSGGFVAKPWRLRGETSAWVGAIGRFRKRTFDDHPPRGKSACGWISTKCPQHVGMAVVQAGSTWHFQTWFRDNNPTPHRQLQRLRYCDLAALGHPGWECATG